MKKYAVIVAGGKGTRMKNKLPKQFLLINDKPVLFYTINAFLTAFEDIVVILVLPKAFIDLGQEIVDAYFGYSRIKIVEGGETRFHSVQNGLKQVSEESVVFVHDAVRCLITGDLLKRCYDTAIEHGNAIPVMNVSDSVRQLNSNGSVALDRAYLKSVQTPQVFYSKIILPAIKIEYKEWFTDEATVIESYGIQPYLVEGENTNIKITHPIDIQIASIILKERMANE